MDTMTMPKLSLNDLDDDTAIVRHLLSVLEGIDLRLASNGMSCFGHDELREEIFDTLNDVRRHRKAFLVR